MSRWKASALHLGISLLVVLSLGTLLALTWYPPAYVRAVGGLNLIAILAAVDATLGPLLTLVVWNVRKPSLRLDMAVIVLLQLSGLAYGLHAIFLARPVYVVFATDRFDLVTAAEIPEGASEQAPLEEFRSLPLAGPQLAAAQAPTEAAERNRLLFSAVAGGADLPQLPKYYRPYRELAAEAARKALPLALLMDRSPEAREMLHVYMEKGKLDPPAIKFLPLRARHRDQAVLVDGSTGDILRIVDIDPWGQ